MKKKTALALAASGLIFAGLISESFAQSPSTRATQTEPDACKNLIAAYEADFKKNPRAFKAKQEEILKNSEQNPDDASLKAIAALMMAVTLANQPATPPLRQGGGRGRISTGGGC